MTDHQLEQHALKLLRGSRSRLEYLDDAREGAPVGNSIVGGVLARQLGVPRSVAEEAVHRAVLLLDSSGAEEAEPGNGGNYTLRRTGKPPLRFQGELLAEEEGDGRDRTRWHSLRVYRTAGGRYVLHIEYTTRFQGESDYCAAWVLEDAVAVGKKLTEYDPTAHVAGFPPGEHYAEKQARLLADIRRRYEAQVSEILASDPGFAEEVA